MVIPILGLLGGTAIGLLTEKFFGGSSSGGSASSYQKGALIEVGTSKVYTTKKDMSTQTYSKSEVYAPTITRTFQPIYTFSPQIMTSSPFSSQTKKETISPNVGISPSVTPTISPIITPIQAESFGSGGSDGGSDLLGNITPFLIIGGIGFAVYHIFKKKGKR